MRKILSNKYIRYSIGIIILLLVSQYVVLLCPSNNIVNIIEDNTNLIATFIGGIIAGFAIIIGLMGTDELKKIHNLKNNGQEDFYLNLINNLKIDFIVIIFSFVISLFSKLFYGCNIEIFDINMPAILTLLSIFLSILIVLELGISILAFAKLRYTLVNTENKNKTTSPLKNQNDKFNE
ncbi:MAG TPA: hypothetical protein PK718_04255 [Candidatus Methanofastidiosa archaeon]|nr:hypothetical protein [Candidatus Methanofastidiosa archaeon]